MTENAEDVRELARMGGAFGMHGTTGEMKVAHVSTAGVHVVLLEVERQLKNGAKDMTKSRMIAVLAATASMGVMGYQSWAVKQSPPPLARQAFSSDLLNIPKVEPIPELPPLAKRETPAAPSTPGTEAAAPEQRGGFVRASQAFDFRGAPETKNGLKSSSKSATTTKQKYAKSNRPLIEQGNQTLTSALNKSYHTKQDFGFSGLKKRKVHRGKPVVKFSHGR